MVNRLHQAGWLFLAILCLCSKTNVAQSAQDSGFDVTTNASKITIIGYHGTSNNIVIPSSINGHSVVGIGGNAFSHKTRLTSVTIPNSVTNIGDNAFDYCSSLTNVTIGSGVTIIGVWAFDYCSSLTNVTIPNSVKNIGDYAFGCCYSLTSVTIPNSVTNIGWDAFGCCTSLTNVTIPNSMKNIGGYAFSYCFSLTNVTIPNSVTSISDDTFYDCSNLTSVTIPNSVTSIGQEAFYGCSSLTNVTIPNSVTKIGYVAFEHCSNLTSVTIPDSVTEIGYGAFEFCSSLTSVTIPNSVTEIGVGPFAECGALTNIGVAAANAYYCSVGGVLFNKSQTVLVQAPAGNMVSYSIPDSVTSLGTYAFSGCSSLTNVTIPDSVTSLGFDAFSDCSSLTNVTIPNSVTSLGGRAFYGCSSLTRVLIPNSVTNIGSFAFVSCTALTNIAVAAGNAYYCSVGGVLFNKSQTVLVEVPAGITSYSIPNNVTNIGDEAFDSCSSLTNVTIPNSVTSIGQEAFCYCSSLTNVTIPNSVTSIAYGAFIYCSSLTLVYFQDNVPASFGSLVYYGTASGFTIYYPSTATGWSTPTWNGYSAKPYTVSQVISVGPANQSFGSIAVGATVDRTFYATNSGSGTLVGSASVSTPFSIVSGGSYILGAGLSQAVVVRYSPTAVDSDSATVTFTGGAGASASVTGFSYALPGIAVPPASLTVAAGSTATFSVTAAGDAPLYYQWLKNGTNIPSATATNFIIASAQTNDAGNYWVVVTNAYGAATSAVAALVVKLPVFPVFSTPILQANNAILIHFTGEPGSNYMIYGSTNLKTWDTITTVRATNGAGSVSVPITSTQLFFRALLTP